MISDADWPGSMEFLIWFRISRRRTAISVPWNYPRCTDFTVRITAAVFIPGQKQLKGKRSGRHRNIQNHNEGGIMKVDPA